VRLKADPETGEWLLPDLNLDDAERAWQVWTLLRATDWHYPQNIDRDAELLHDVLEIEAASVLVKRMLEELNKKPETMPRHGRRKDH
jgi:hypothetical protein